MCEFKIIVNEPGKDETLVTDDISYLKIQDDGNLLLRGLGIQKRIENVIIQEVNTYAEDGAIAKLFKLPIIGDLMKFLKYLEEGAYTSELEKCWREFVEKGQTLIEKLKIK